MRKLSEGVASASAIVSSSSSLEGFFKLRKVRNVAKPDVVVYLVLSSKSVVIFSSFFNPSQAVGLILRDVVGHQSFNLQLT